MSNRCLSLFYKGLLLIGQLLLMSAFTGCAPTIHLAGDIMSVDKVPPPEQTYSDPQTLGLPILDIKDHSRVYRIGPRDEIIVSVWGRPDLGSQIPAQGDNRRNISIVQEDGYISLPLIGRVKVAGLTAAESAAQIEKAYESSVDMPTVDVTVVSYRSHSVVVEGDVERPGPVYLSNTVRSLADALKAAGSLKSTSETTRALLTRNGVTYALNYREAALGQSPVHQVALQDGDRVYVPREDEYTVAVFGEVRNPGRMSIPAHGLTLLDALGSAGAPKVDTANYDCIYLVRKNKGVYKVAKLSLEDILTGPEVVLAGGDRIFIPPTGLANWDRTLRQAISALRL